MSGGPRIITADGEYEASKRLAAAANVMAATPPRCSRRLLQTVVEVAGEKNSTLVMPVPVAELAPGSKINPPGGCGPAEPAAARPRWPTSATRTWPRKQAEIESGAPLDRPEVLPVPEPCRARGTRPPAGGGSGEISSSKPSAA